MMSMFSSHKLVALGFFKAHAMPAPLQLCEELYIYGILNQLGRLTELSYRDLATLPDRVLPPMDLHAPDTQQRFLHICQSSRTRYLLTGAFELSATSKNVVNLYFKLYDAQQKRYSVESSHALPFDGFAFQEVATAGASSTVPETSPALTFQGEALNQAIQQSLARLLPVLLNPSPPSSAILPQTIPPYSTVLSAMYCMLKAHQTPAPLEKLQFYEMALQQDPQMETAYYHLARLYKNEAYYDQSVVYYRETLKISHASPRNKAIYATEAGICCALLGKQELALQWWQRATQYDSSFINPYFNIANTYEDLENYEQAETYFLKAQELAPDDFRTFFNLARIYSKMGIWEKALTQYHHQLQVEKDDPWCHSDLATCYLHLGDSAKAKHHLEATLELDPNGEAGQYAQLILMGMD